MAAARFCIVFTLSAWSDLEEIVAYWTGRGDAERGQQYARDLPAEAIRQLGNPAVAASGRYLRHTAYQEVQELPVFKRAYRILYLVKAADETVKVLRFWHSHRDEPFEIN